MTPISKPRTPFPLSVKYQLYWTFTFLIAYWRFGRFFGLAGEAIISEQSRNDVFGIHTNHFFYKSEFIFNYLFRSMVVILLFFIIVLLNLIMCPKTQFIQYCAYWRYQSRRGLKWDTHFNRRCKNFTGGYNLDFNILC